MPPKKSERQNIRVAVRCRPLNKKEYTEGEVNVVESCKDQKITLKDKSSSSRSYTFDRVFGTQSKQKDVYTEMVAPTVVEVIEGYNCTIFAYGQTGTGKTFTMTGERSDALRYTWETDPMTGIIPRALSQIFGTLEVMECDFSVRVSFMELYNEELFDLLSSGDENIRLAVYDDSNKKGSVLVKGLREVAVHNKEEVFAIIEKGLLRRQTACTLMNAQSSRSHTVFTVTVHIKEVNQEDEVFLKIGKLNLVDLAGSENIGRSGAQDKRAREAGSINQSLLTLGRVITCLVDHSPHIPYRESKLTRLLQDSLGGRTKTSIIATISPGSASLEETVSTLDYAHRAKNIQNRPEINQKLNKNQLIKGYNEELERLRKDLEATRTKTGIFIDADNYATLQHQLKQQRCRIDDLESRKDLLQLDLESAMSNFELSQQELAEVRESKQRVEQELVEVTDIMQRASRRLEKTERQLEEEKYLLLQHQCTEERLSEQASELLSAASTFQNDTGHLHQKLEKIASLDSNNKFALESLHSAWLPDNLREPIQMLASSKEDMSHSIQKLSNDLTIFRRRLDVAGKQSFEEINRLSTSLANIVAANLVKAASTVVELSQTHVRVVGEFRDSTMTPTMAAVTQIGVNLEERLAGLRQRLSAEATAQTAMCNQLINKVETLSKSANAWDQLREVELEENARLRAEIDSRRQTESSETYALVNTLQEAMSRLSVLTETRMESDKIMNKALTSRTGRLVSLASAEKAALNKIASEVCSSVTSASDARVAAIKGITSDVGVCSSCVTDLHDNIHQAGDACATLFANTSSSASAFISSGVGSQLRDQANQWKAVVEESGDSPVLDSVDHFHRLTESTNSRLKAHEVEATDAIDQLAEIVAATNAHLPVLDDVSSALVPRLPNLLASHLTQSFKAYAPTGMTPHRRQVSYPTELASTGRHTALLEDFRRAKGFSGVEENPLSDMTNAEISRTSVVPSDSTLDSSSAQKDENGCEMLSEGGGSCDSSVILPPISDRRGAAKVDKRSPELSSQSGSPSAKRRRKPKTTTH